MKTTIHQQQKQTMRLSALAMSLLISSVVRGISKVTSNFNSIDCSNVFSTINAPKDLASPEQEYAYQSIRSLGFNGQTFWQQISNIRGGNPGITGVS